MARGTLKQTGFMITTRISSPSEALITTSPTRGEHGMHTVYVEVNQNSSTVTKVDELSDLTLYIRVHYDG